MSDQHGIDRAEQIAAQPGTEPDSGHSSFRGTVTTSRDVNGSRCRLELYQSTMAEPRLARTTRTAILTHRFSRATVGKKHRSPRGGFARSCLCCRTRRRGLLGIIRRSTRIRYSFCQALNTGAFRSAISTRSSAMLCAATDQGSSGRSLLTVEGGSCSRMVRASMPKLEPTPRSGRQWIVARRPATP